MADGASSARRPSAQKKRAPAGQWPSPDKSMGTAPATHTIESIVVETDKVAAFPRSKKAGRKSEEGLLWSFDFQLLSDGEVHRRTTIMSKWTVQPNERAGGAWREGAVAKIKKWIEVAENVERAAAEEAAAQSDAEMEGVVPAVVRTSTLDHSPVLSGGGGGGRHRGGVLPQQRGGLWQEHRRHAGRRGGEALAMVTLLCRALSYSPAIFVSSSFFVDILRNRVAVR